MSLVQGGLIEGVGLQYFQLAVPCIYKQIWKSWLMFTIKTSFHTLYETKWSTAINKKSVHYSQGVSSCVFGHFNFYSCKGGLKGVETWIEEIQHATKAELYQEGSYTGLLQL